jgi:serine/threonine protein kinase/predicted ATPase
MPIPCPNCRKPVEASGLKEITCPDCGHGFHPDTDPTVDEREANTQTFPQVSEQAETVGPYRLLRRLGQGGMGIVYEALDTRLHRLVALKFVPEGAVKDSQRLERFRREAIAASTLNHPNICTVFDVGEHHGRPFIVMELVEGETLRSLATPLMASKTLAHLGAQAARALAAAHASGVVHRDIKPDNLMVRTDGYVKVLDFGVACLVTGQAKQGIPETGSAGLGPVKGTMPYMSPEQVRGEATSAATDIFSLGVTFYELVTGRRPFRADSAASTEQAILNDSVLSPSRLNPEVSPTLDALISRMLQKHARLRPTAKEVEETLVREASELSGSSVVTERTDNRHSVGRHAERKALRAAFGSVLAGKGLLVCIAGEPGIGKTTLVEDFISDLAITGHPFVVARGPCSERLAGTEAYLPFLEAIDRLLQGDMADSIARTLKLLAPSWYAQVLPASADDSPPVTDVQAGRSQERMKRELRAFFQDVCRLRPLILFFDDLQWADASTVDLMSYLATKLDELRLLIVAAYRTSDLLQAKHPFLSLKLDLTARGLSREISLEFLKPDDVEAYLALQFPHNAFPAELAHLIHAKTEGNALFMVDLVRFLRDGDVISEQQGRWILAKPFPEVGRDLPASMRGMIERKIGQMSEEDRRLLMVASVQGYEFDSTVLAGAAGADCADVEDRLEKLDRVLSLVRSAGEREFPDRVPTVRYHFVHVLYQNALYGSLTPTRRATMSLAVAEAIHGHYGQRSGEVALQLADLFQNARDPARAANFYRRAAQNDAQVHAHTEAVILATRGLAQARMLPESEERDQLEMMLELTSGYSLAQTKGYSAPETRSSMDRARELCEKLGETRVIFRAILGVYLTAMIGGRFKLAADLAQELVRHAENSQDAFLLAGAHIAMAFTLGCQGRPALAYEHSRRGFAHYDPTKSSLYNSFYGHEIGVYGRCLTARIIWRLGYPDEARRWVEEGLRLARAEGSTQSLAAALSSFSWLHLELRNIDELLQTTADLIAYCKKHGFVSVGLVHTVVRGWAIGEQGNLPEGIMLMREGLNHLREVNSEIYLPQFLALLADQMAKAGQTRESLAALNEAMQIAEKNGEHFWDSELYRLKGELLARSATETEEPIGAGNTPEVCVRKALDIARQQEAKSLELRAAMSLARLPKEQARQKEAHRILAEAYNWFTEGLDTADLKQAKALLQEFA